MTFIAKKSETIDLKTQCAVVFITEKTLSESATKLDEKLNNKISQLVKQGDLADKAGASQWLFPEDAAIQRVLLIQTGKASTATLTGWKTAIQSAAKVLVNSPSKDATFYLDALTEIDLNEFAKLFPAAFSQATYQYSETKPSAKKSALKAPKVTLVSNDAQTVKALKKALSEGEALASGVALAKELGNLPGNVCTPTYLANLAKTLAAESNGLLKVKILTEKQMEKLGMGSLLSVAAGSDEEAKLIVMEYSGKDTKTKPNVLVGKGITFDTGGISLKPGAAMDEMKFDMCGAASVFGTVKSLLGMQAKVNMVGIVAAAENMPSGRATKPGDVVTSMSGQTIEVLNTDAEGRLVLCDALTYAERYKPKTLIDIATLTGACVIALGSHATGLYANDQELANKLLASGEKTLDRAWQMPLWDEYQKQLDSNFADIANIGGREAGSVTAACFLARFTEKQKWAHLDIAGTAWNSGANKGATGRPVSLLVDYLLHN